jgi:8-oxo-dGTP pyrophosphatase MutT (NUDIX family)
MLNFFSRLPSGLTKRLVHAQALLRNPYCLGVRIVVRDGDGAVLLARHSYLPGWYLPGGGVDKGETMAMAAARELAEEAGIQCDRPPELMGIYLSREAFGRDHVGLYLVENWRPGERFLQQNSEIVEARFWHLDALPADISPATWRRLHELKQDRLGEDGGGYW